MAVASAFVRNLGCVSGGNVGNKKCRCLSDLKPGLSYKSQTDILIVRVLADFFF